MVIALEIFHQLLEKLFEAMYVMQTQPSNAIYTTECSKTDKSSLIRGLLSVNARITMTDENSGSAVSALKRHG
jgi:hypothetical protein